MKLGNIVKLLYALVLGFIFLAGCAGTTPSLGKLGKSSNYESNKKTGNYKEISKNLIKNEKNDLLWYYDAGLISRYASDYNQSIYFFDKSETKIKKYDQEVMAGKLLANIGAVLTNDTFMDYRPKIYEGILVNTYKGMDFINRGDFANARVEFNRALDRQRRAKEFFAKEINQEKKKIEQESKKNAKDKKVDTNKLTQAAASKQTRDAIEKKYTNLFAFKPYPDFLNPFTSYMSGIFFLNIGDYQKATNILKEAYGMIKGNENGATYVKNDLKLAIKMKSSLNARMANHYAWVIFSNGDGPSKKELRFDIPLFFITRSVYYTGIALPTFKENPAAFSKLYVKNGKNAIQTKEVASMDKIIKTEFKKRFPTIMTRAIIRTFTQTMVQYQLHDKTGFIGGLIGSIYQGVMNRADTRQWRNLPKNFQIARIRLRSSKLQIFSPNHKKLADLKINPKRNYIVFLRMATSKSKPVVSYQVF